MTTALAVSLSLLSGAIGALVSTWIFIRRENRRMKLETLRELLGNKFRMLSPEFFKPLNEIFVVYNDSPDVLKKLEGVISNAKRSSTSPNPDADDDLIKLMRAMCTAAGLNHAKVTDSSFLTYLGPGVRAVHLPTRQGQPPTAS